MLWSVPTLFFPQPVQPLLVPPECHQAWWNCVALGGKKPGSETVRTALEAGVDVKNKEANTGYTPLIAAVASDANDGLDVVAMVLYLLELGADIYAVEDNRCSAFLLAAKTGADEVVVKALLDLGAKIDCC